MQVQGGLPWPCCHMAEPEAVRGDVWKPSEAFACRVVGGGNARANVNLSKFVRRGSPGDGVAGPFRRALVGNFVSIGTQLRDWIAFGAACSCSVHDDVTGRPRGRSMFALSYICRFSIFFSRLIRPSVCPFDHGARIAAATALPSRRRPRAKGAIMLSSASSSQATEALSRALRTLSVNRSVTARARAAKTIRQEPARGVHREHMAEVTHLVLPS